MPSADPADVARRTGMFSRRHIVAGAAGALVLLPAAIALGTPFPRRHDGHATPAGSAQASPHASPAPATPAIATPGATPAQAPETTVVIVDLLFDPPEIEVPVGTTVTWINQDDVAHTATNTDGVFDTGTILAGERGSHTFDTAGRYEYVCIYHADMDGVVVVR